MSGKQISTHALKKAIVTTALMFSLAPVAIQADSRLADEPLPRPEIKTEECLNVDELGWGWDGQQSCFISSFYFYDEPEPLISTSRDYGGTARVWNRQDVADRTLRCDSYKRRYDRKISGSRYFRYRYDITFLTQDQIPASASAENLSDVTGHIYTRGWEIGQFGQLDAGPIINLNRWGFATETGHIFVEDVTRESNDVIMIDQFSHCFYRDEDTPLQPSGYCVDYDGDGIGWNGTENCEVVVDPDCDYSKSDQGSNIGWGYNPITGESCPPRGNETSPYIPKDECSRESGWGWNEYRQQSCREDD